MDRTALLKRLTTAPERVGVAARRVAARESAGGPLRGEWTAREVVGHLVAVETEVWQARLDALAAGPRPEWSWIEPGVSDEPDAATLEGAITRFAALRAATLARLVALDDAGWARWGVHATYGRLDVGGMFGVAADHDDDHLAALEARIPDDAGPAGPAGSRAGPRVTRVTRVTPRDPPTPPGPAGSRR